MPLTKKSTPKSTLNACPYQEAAISEVERPDGRDVPLFTPPRPKSLGPLSALLRAIISGDSNLIGLLPKEAYTMDIGPLGYSRRSIVIINDPTSVREIMTDPTNIYPKNDLMVGALAPLVGESIFVSSGDKWRKQRAMIAPAFTHMRVSDAFESMTDAIADYDALFTQYASGDKPFSLDLAMSHLTADIICRTVFSTPLASETAKDVFEAFTLFERSVAHVEIKRLITSPAFSEIPQHDYVLDACKRIRKHLGALADDHLKPDANFKDIAADVASAKDPETGEGFSREEYIDQLGVFFLAGHETTASALTWAFYMIATQPALAQRIRDEVELVTEEAPLELQHIHKLHFVRSVFKETMRLYPPITFIPRVAAESTEVLGRKLKRGAMVMIAPWVIHRHHKYWENPDMFDAERFMPHREKEIKPNSYMPFGLGPRICVGANFATIESTLILAHLCRKFDFTALEPEKVEPVARLTTRPKDEIKMTVRLN